MMLYSIKAGCGHIKEMKEDTRIFFYRPIMDTCHLAYSGHIFCGTNAIETVHHRSM